MSQAIPIADAVTVELAAQYAAQFTPVRRLLPIRELDKMGDAIQVAVIPRLVEQERASRAARRKLFTIDVGIQRRVGSDPEGVGAAIVALAEDVGDFLFERALAQYPSAKYFGQTLVAYSPEHLHDHNLATSVVTIQYVIQ